MKIKYKYLLGLIYLILFIVSVLYIYRTNKETYEVAHTATFTMPPNSLNFTKINIEIPNDFFVKKYLKIFEQTNFIPIESSIAQVTNRANNSDPRFIDGIIVKGNNFIKSVSVTLNGVILTSWSTFFYSKINTASLSRETTSGPFLRQKIDFNIPDYLINKTPIDLHQEFVLEGDYVNFTRPPKYFPIDSYSIELFLQSSQNSEYELFINAPPYFAIKNIKVESTRDKPPFNSLQQAQESVNSGKTAIYKIDMSKDQYFHIKLDLVREVSLKPFWIGSILILIVFISFFVAYQPKSSISLIFYDYSLFFISTLILGFLSFGLPVNEFTILHLVSMGAFLIGLFVFDLRNKNDRLNKLFFRPLIWLLLLLLLIFYWLNI